VKARRQGFASRKYLALRKLIGGRGRRAEAITPGEVLRMSDGLAVEKEIREFLGMYEKDRFGKRPMTSPERTRYDLLLKSIRTGLERRRG
jgi:hypothetical protein